MKPPTTYNERVTKLETEVEGLHDSVVVLGRNITALGDRIDNRVSDITKSIDASRNPNWQTLIAAGSFIIALSLLAVTVIAGLRSESIAKFSEVETQFKGVTQAIQVQVDFNKSFADSSKADRAELRSQIDGDKGIRERMAKVEQRQADVDEYVIPQVYENQAAVNKLREAASENSARIDERAGKPLRDITPGNSRKPPTE